MILTAFFVSISFAQDASVATVKSDAPNAFAFTLDIEATDYPDVDYEQPLRPQFHFSSKRGWINDPNGMLFDGKQYHLFFQHNPKHTEWGNMTWGHAVSQDMVHWKQLKHALLPYKVDGRSGTIFSGTAVIDHNNSLGKQVGDQKTIVAFFTFANEPKFYQAMAYSTDGGNTFTYWNDGRAVVENQGFDNGERDPKVFWHEPSQQWVMALWVQLKPGRIRWFTSKNLVDWEFTSDLMRDWAYECMDVVFLPVDGDKNNMKCLIYDASFDYEVGSFDGKQFHSETQPLLNMRGNFYAAQTFNNMPDGRVVQIGWMRTHHNVAAQFGLPFNQQMAFPCELTLHQTTDGPRLRCYPIREIESLVTSEFNLKDTLLNPNQNLLEGQSDLDLVDLKFSFMPTDPSVVTIQLPRVTLRYDSKTRRVEHQGINDKGDSVWMTTLEDVKPIDGRIELRCLVDRMTVEVYANHGEMFGAYYLHPDNDPKEYCLRSSEPIRVQSLSLRKLRSSWK